MTDETQSAEVPASDPAPLPPSLKPFSASCLVPVAIALVVMGLAYLGIQRIESNTGPWAIAAANNGLAESGLPEDRQAPFTSEVDRLRTAFEAGEITPPEVVNGVAGLLETSTVPLLVVDDVLDRRLPASGLSQAKKDSIVEALKKFRLVADAGLLKYQELLFVLGPLALTKEDGGPQSDLSDEEIVEMATRAASTVADKKAPKVEVIPTYDVLLQRYRDHVTAVLDGTATVVERAE